MRCQPLASGGRRAGAPELYRAEPDLTPDDRAQTLAHLDLAEGRGPVQLLDDRGIRDLLSRSPRIAVIGASAKPGRPSHDVFRYLVSQGLDCVPINPNVTAVLGITAYPTLGSAVAATGPVDVVDVFRRSELCVVHAEEAVSVGARCLWLQIGVVNWQAAEIAHAGGLSVVMDRCTAVEVRRTSGF